MAISPALVNDSRAERAVAQLGSALEWGSRGRGFKSRRPEEISLPKEHRWAASRVLLFAAGDISAGPQVKCLSSDVGVTSANDLRQLRHRLSRASVRAYVKRRNRGVAERRQIHSF